MKLNIKIMKILINGKDTAELSTFCKWSVKDGKLFNKNTRRFEGVDGDKVTFIKENGNKYEGTVSWYTCYQVIPTKETGVEILSPKEVLSVEIEHRSVVEELKGDEPPLEKSLEESNIFYRRNRQYDQKVLEYLIKENVKFPFAFYSYATIISILLALGIISLFEFLF
jgi:hypothetical protein